MSRTRDTPSPIIYTCVICLEDIHDIFSEKCTKCNTCIHTECERQYRKSKGYSIKQRICVQCNTNTVVTYCQVENAKSKTKFASAAHNELMQSFINELDL